MDLTATEVLKAIRARQLKPLDVLDATFRQIEKLNPTLNAVITLASQSARDQAEVIEQRLARGESMPPLAGLPILIKDNQRTKGLRTTLGSALHLNDVPLEDAGIVARLRHAGAIIIGKTNIPEYSIGANTVNPVFGATGNPYNPELTCGGSSGGSAVAVASKMVTLATGSDHGGSLRIPASFCGVVGVRCTPGTVPNEERRTPSTHYSLQGPLARNVTDAGLMLSVIADRTHGGERDPMAFPLDASRFAKLDDIDPSSLKVAVTADLGGLLVSNETRGLFRSRVNAMAAWFKRCDWHDIDLTDAPDVDWHLRQDVFVTQYFEQAGTWPEDFNPNVMATYRAAEKTSMTAIAKARHRQLLLIRKCQTLFQDYDLLITPGVSVQPFPWTLAYPKQIDGRPVENYMAWLHLTSALTVTGHPVVSLPAGLDSNGLPFGIQLVGPMYQDHKLLSMAKAVEQMGSSSERFKQPQ